MGSRPHVYVRARIGAAFDFVIGDFGGRVLLACMSLLVARRIGPSEYGSLSLALAVSSFGACLVDLGLTHTYIREATKAGSDRVALLRWSLIARSAFAVMASGAIASWSVLTYGTAALGKTVIVVALPMLWGVTLQSLASGYLLAGNRPRTAAWLRGANSGASAAVVLFAYLGRATTITYAAAYGLASLGVGISALVMMRDAFKGARSWQPGLFRGLLPFSGSAVLGLASPQIVPLLLERLAELGDVGLFSGAARFPTFLSQVPAALSLSVYGLLFRLGNTDRAAHRFVGIQQVALVGGVASLLAFILMESAEVLVLTLLGPEWKEAAIILRWLAPSVLVQSLGMVIGDLLTTSGAQARRLLGLGLGLGVTVVVSALLIPPLGAFGGAIGLLIGQVSLVIAFFFLGGSRIRYLAWVVLQLLAAFGLAVALTSLGPWGLVLGATVITGASMLTLVRAENETVTFVPREPEARP